jgi:hypothetical protein
MIGAELAEEDRDEQLWARQVGDRRFEICCIPFFVYDMALGDVVETDANHRRSQRSWSSSVRCSSGRRPISSGSTQPMNNTPRPSRTTWRNRNK